MKAVNDVSNVKYLVLVSHMMYDFLYQYVSHNIAIIQQIDVIFAEFWISLARFILDVKCRTFFRLFNFSVRLLSARN
jgi:hypothetical protein